MVTGEGDGKTVQWDQDIVDTNRKENKAHTAYKLPDDHNSWVDNPEVGETKYTHIIYINRY